MELGIQRHLAWLSLSDTVRTLEELGVDRCRTTVQNMVQKANLQPLDGTNPEVDNSIILVDGALWLQAACHRHGL